MTELTTIRVHGSSDDLMCCIVDTQVEVVGGTRYEIAEMSALHHKGILVTPAGGSDPYAIYGVLVEGVWCFYVGFPPGAYDGCPIGEVDVAMRQHQLAEYSTELVLTVPVGSQVSPIEGRTLGV